MKCCCISNCCCGLFKANEFTFCPLPNPAAPLLTATGCVLLPLLLLLLLLLRGLSPEETWDVACAASAVVSILLLFHNGLLCTKELNASSTALFAAVWLELLLSLSPSLVAVPLNRLFLPLGVTAACASFPFVISLSLCLSLALPSND